MSKLSYIAATGLLLVGLSANVSAELISTPDGGKKEAYTVMLPGRGMGKEAVQKQFGQPIKRTAPVGNPPISSWQYDLFTVYFESDYVIHAVVNEL